MSKESQNEFQIKNIMSAEEKEKKLVRLKNLQDLVKEPFYRSLLVLHLNIDDLQKNFDLLKHFFCLDQNGPDVICLSKIGNPEEIPRIDAKNYHYQSFCLSNSKEKKINEKNGVAIYVKSKLKGFEPKNLPNIIDTGKKTKEKKNIYFICLWVELVDGEGKHVVIGVMNVQPYDVVETINGGLIEKDFSPIINQVKEGKTFYFFGDVKLMQLQSLTEKIKLEPLLLIKKETKTMNKQIANDCIFTTDQLKILSKKSIGIVKTTEVSNYYPIYCFIPNGTFYNDVEYDVVLSLQAQRSLESYKTAIQKHKKMQQDETPDMPQTSKTIAFSSLQDKIKVVTDLIQNFENL